jgi:hypothetical protein
MSATEFKAYPETLFGIQIKTTSEQGSSVEGVFTSSVIAMCSYLPGRPSNHDLAVYKFVGTRPFDELQDEEEATVKEVYALEQLAVDSISWEGSPLWDWLQD